MWWNITTFSIKAIIVIWLFSYLLRPFLPDRYNEIAKIIGLRLLSILVFIPKFVRDLWVISSTLMYYLGMFSILGLLVVGAFIFGYTLLIELGITYADADPYYKLLSHLAESKVAWAGATVIIASTVAIGHMWNLRINSVKFEEEMKKFEREEIEAKKKNDEELKSARTSWLGDA